MADDTYSQIPCDITTLEFQKFTLDDDGKVIVKTTATGSFRITGLTTGGKIIELPLTDGAWTQVTTGLADANHLSVQNLSNDDIKLNFDNTVPGYVGVLLAAGSERHYDIQPGIAIYAKPAPGTNPTIVVEELA